MITGGLGSKTSICAQTNILIAPLGYINGSLLTTHRHNPKRYTGQGESGLRKADAGMGVQAGSMRRYASGGRVLRINTPAIQLMFRRTAISAASNIDGPKGTWVRRLPRRVMSIATPISAEMTNAPVAP